MNQEKKRKLPIELTVFTSHNLPDESISDSRVTAMKAEKCAYMAEGLFRVMAKVCKDAAFGDRSTERIPLTETEVLALAHCAEVGAALTTACTEFIDQIEISSQRAKSI